MQTDSAPEIHAHGHSVLIIPIEQRSPGEQSYRTQQVAEALRRHGHSVEVMPLFSSQEKMPGAIGVIPGIRTATSLRRWRAALTAIRQSDVVQIDIDLDRSPLFPATILLAVSGFLGKRTVLSVSSVRAESINGVRGQLIRRMIRLATSVVTGSDKAAGALAPVKSNISVIQLTSTGAIPAHPQRHHAIQPRVAAVAPIDPHSLSMLVRAVAMTKQKYPRAEVVILTTPEDSRRVGLSVERLSQSGADLIVCRSEEQILQELRLCDLYFESSPTLDSSRPLIEALSGGIPVLCPDLAGTELIEHGVSGLIIEAGNHVDLANRLCELVESTDLARTLAAHGRLVARQFDSEITDSAWATLYSSFGNVSPESARTLGRVSPRFQPAVKS